MKGPTPFTGQDFALGTNRIILFSRKLLRPGQLTRTFPCFGHQRSQNPSQAVDTSSARNPAVSWKPAEPEFQLCREHHQSKNCYRYCVLDTSSARIPAVSWTPAEPESQLCLDTSRTRIPAVFGHQQSQNPSCVWDTSRARIPAVFGHQQSQNPSCV